MRYSLRSISMTLGWAFALASTAHSTTIHVPADAPTIQAGVDLASPGDTVEVACGTYPGGVTLKDSIVLRSQTGLTGCVTMQCTSNIAGLYCSNLTSGVVIEGIDFDGMFDAYVGGIRATQSNVTARNCLIKRFVNGFGGGIHASSSTVHLENCVFSNNEQDLDSEAGSGLSCFASIVTIVDSTFEENRHGNRGGAIGSVNSSVSIDGCMFRKNRGESMYQSLVSGAAIWAWLGTLSIRSSTFEENVCHSAGSAIFMDDGSLQLEDCIFDRNKSYEVWGSGCVYFNHGLIQNCTFKNNEGGAVLGNASTKPLMIRDSLFDQNRSNFSTSIIAIYGQGCLIERCTIVQSECLESEAASLYAAAPVVLRGSIIAFGNETKAIACAGSGTIVAECCDIYGNGGGDWVGCLMGQDGTNGNISADPFFCDLPGGDFALHADSPCAPPQSGVCGQIGAFGVGCGSVHVEPSSWGAIKALYR